MEGGEGGIVFEGEVQAGDVPVVVATVDEEVGFFAGVGFRGAVEEVALAVGLFADVVTVGHILATFPYPHLPVLLT